MFGKNVIASMARTLRKIGMVDAPELVAYFISRGAVRQGTTIMIGPKYGFEE